MLAAEDVANSSRSSRQADERQKRLERELRAVDNAVGRSAAISIGHFLRCGRPDPAVPWARFRGESWYCEHGYLEALDCPLPDCPSAAEPLLEDAAAA